MHRYLLKEIYQLYHQYHHHQQTEIITIKEVVLKNCASFTDCISETNNSQLDNAKDVDTVMTMYNLIEYSNNQEKIGNLWQYYRDESFLDNNGAIADFPAANNNSALFTFKQKITRKTVAGGTKDVEIMMPAKYLKRYCTPAMTSYFMKFYFVK